MADALPWSREEMLVRMRASERAADGFFITGVTSTGIYCLPSCPARTPKPENVVFHASEASARAAGLRPCKRCRPDDYYAGVERDREAFHAALQALRDNPASVPDVAAFADRVGVGPTKLHALALRYFGEPPGALIHRSRIEVAERLLAAGEVTATGAAFAVGYASVSAFYERFKASTGTTPGAVARRGGA